MHRHFITPLDIPQNDNYSVLLVDPTRDELNKIATFKQGLSKEINAYVYLSSMNNIDWLEMLTHQVDAVVVNTAVNSLSPVKTRLIQGLDHSWYYGKSIFSNNPRRLDSAMSFFDAVVSKI